jgi:CheY-like chemotaxis protein
MGSMSQLISRSTILVVDDEVLIRMMVADSLEESGLSVIEAGDADEALALLGQHPEIGLLFTDVNMPGEMDGFGLAARAINARPDLRLVMSSGREYFTDASLPDHGKFIAKPYKTAELVALVHRELGARFS